MFEENDDVDYDKFQFIIFVFVVIILVVDEEVMEFLIFLGNFIGYYEWFIKLGKLVVSSMGFSEVQEVMEILLLYWVLWLFMFGVLKKV